MDLSCFLGSPLSFLESLGLAMAFQTFTVHLAPLKTFHVFTPFTDHLHFPCWPLLKLDTLAVVSVLMSSDAPFPHPSS